jgi:hypothetical protein
MELLRDRGRAADRRRVRRRARCLPDGNGGRSGLQRQQLLVQIGLGAGPPALMAEEPGEAGPRSACWRAIG